MASSEARRIGSIVSSSTTRTSYTLTHSYRRKFRKTSMSQNLPVNRLYLTGSRSLNREGQLRTSTLSQMTSEPLRTEDDSY